MIFITLMVNLFVGSLLYVYFTRSIDDVKVVCEISFVDNKKIKGNIVIKNSSSVKIDPIDYQIMLVDKGENILQSFSNPIMNKDISFEGTLLITDFFDIKGYLNANVKFFWIKKYMTFPLEWKK